jgi:hypothetical protein
MSFHILPNNILSSQSQPTFILQLVFAPSQRNLYITCDIVKLSHAIVQFSTFVASIAKPANALKPSEYSSIRLLAEERTWVMRSGPPGA